MRIDHLVDLLYDFPRQVDVRFVDVLDGDGVAAEDARRREDALSGVAEHVG